MVARIGLIGKRLVGLIAMVENAAPSIQRYAKLIEVVHCGASELLSVGRLLSSTWLLGQRELTRCCSSGERLSRCAAGVAVDGAQVLTGGQRWRRRRR